MFTTEMSEREVVNAVRNTFKAFIPESNAWAEPNHMSVSAQVFGGLAFSALCEARGGVDARVMIDTAEGAYLDAIAARPPYNTTRLPASKASGDLDVTFPGVAVVLTGEVFTRDDGQEYTVLCDATLDADGVGVVKVEAVEAGVAGNAVYGYPFVDARGDVSVSLMGLNGGSAIECDDALKDRLYALQPFTQFGSVKSLEQYAVGLPGVASAKGCRDIGGVDLYFTSDNGPIPTAGEVAAVQAAFDDPCRKMIGLCTRVRAATALTINVTITDPCPAGVSDADMSAALTAWLDANAMLGQGFAGGDIKDALQEAFPGLSLSSGCEDYRAYVGGLYTTGVVTFA